MAVEPRFLADATLGKLARWLRILGYDTRLGDASLNAAQLVRLARAEQRILLTRDSAVARRRGVRAVLIRSGQLEQQMAQLQDELGVSAVAPFTRCPVCNVELEAIPKDRAWGQVPPYVFCTQDEFRVCPNCDRFYWRGTHRQLMGERVAEWAQDERTEDGR
ncbi:MAG: hypothetical protein GX552_01290 [Chloroflexi bacterium]|jgi:uncharacterized protein with PIN domain|nr:hypothetical protein [Chloroflexota bacterium]